MKQSLTFCGFLYQLTTYLEEPRFSETPNSCKELTQKTIEACKIESIQKPKMLKLYRKKPVFPSEHVYLLFNFLLKKFVEINKKALLVSNREQSVFRTWFYHKKVVKVQKMRNVVVITANWAPPIIQQQSSDEFVEYLRSFANSKLQNIANLIVQIKQQIFLLKAKIAQKKVKVQNESIAKCIKQLESQMFVYKFVDNKMAISQELLNYLGYDLEQFSVQAVKYKTVFFDFMSSNSYFKMVEHFLKLTKLCFQLDQQKITEQEFLRCNKIQFNDFIYSKNNKKSYCNLQFIVLPKLTTCIRVKKILFIQSSNALEDLRNLQNGFGQYKNQIIQEEYKLLNSIGIVPKNWLQISEDRMTGFKRKQKLKKAAFCQVHFQ